MKKWVRFVKGTILNLILVNASISAMNVNNRYTFIISIFFGLKYITQIKGDSSFTVNPYTVKHFPASLQCTVTPLSGSVEFQRNSNLQGQCSVPNISASCTPSVSQSGDTTYFNITSLNYTQHDGVWTCVNALPNRNVTLIVYSPYGDTSITVTSQGDNALATCQMKCQYPINDDFTSVEIWKSDGKVKSVTSYTASDPSTNDGCEAHEKNLVATFNLSSTDVCGNADFYCRFNHNVLGTNNSISTRFTFQGCQLSTVQSSTVQPSTPEPSPSFQPCLISNSLLLWHCIVIWIVIGVAVIILVGCCIFCLWKKRQNSEKKQSTKNNEMQDLKDKSRNNKTFDDKTENKDRTDTKSVDKSEKKQSTENNEMQDLKDKSRNNKAFDDKTENKPDRTDIKSYDKSGYDRSGNDKSGNDKSGYDKSGYDKSGYDKSGYDKSGFDKSGYDKSGYNKSGSGYEKSGYHKSGYDNLGYDKSGYKS